jgi:hypothetical protein
VIVHARMVTQPVLQEFERQLAGDIAYIYILLHVIFRTVVVGSFRSNPSPGVSSVVSSLPPNTRISPACVIQSICSEIA